MQPVQQRRTSMNGIDPPNFVPCAPPNEDSLDPFDWAEAFLRADETDLKRVACWFRNAMRAAHEGAPSNLDGFADTAPPTE
jgi:hypothetical protein